VHEPGRERPAVVVPRGAPARLRAQVATAAVLLRPAGGHLVDDAGAVLEFLRGTRA
jgi:nitrate/nitrite transporter NarK